MFRVIAAVALCACATVQQRFPDDVQTALSHHDMRRLETDRFIIYYEAPRRAEVDRFIARADRCASLLRDQAMIHDGDKMVIVMPDVAFNNAFVAPDLLGYEAVSVIPLHATLDFATEFGLPPDPGFIACHELVHYVHDQQIAGFWKALDKMFGHLYTPQAGYDPWFFEGLATHYEAELSPGVGRPAWPLFTGVFAAAYAGQHVGSGELSALGREASMGHHYLVGTMFVKFLTETYGDKAMWLAIGNQSRALTGWLFPTTFKAGFNKSFGTLFDEFDAWVGKKFPVRTATQPQRRLAIVGNDARYARGRDGTEAWVADDVDEPAHLVVKNAAGNQLADISMVDVLPPRVLVQGEPLLVSGLSITADGREVWLTVIDLGPTYQIPRLLRWRHGSSRLEEVANDLGPGATIDPTGQIYYYCAVDGDRWSLAAWDHGKSRVLVDMQPGTYVLGAQISPDGKQLVANVWDGTAFVAWVVDAASGAVVRRIAGVGPVYDASFTSDGRVMWLGVVDERFQAIIEGKKATDAPYAVLAAREVGGTIRFLDREGWEWELAAVPTPATTEAWPDTATPATPVAGAATTPDSPYCMWDHFFYPQVRSPALLVTSKGGPHVGVVLGGGDRLGLQRWSLAGYVQSTSYSHVHGAATVGYLNTMLAPVTILATASWIDWADPVATDDPMVTLVEERRTRDAQLVLARTWRGDFTVGAGGVYTDDYDLAPAFPAVRRHLGGPELGLSWTPLEGTRYTGARRGLLVGASVAWYPRQLSTFASNITDVGEEIGGVLPLPFGRRHTLTATVRSRALLASRDTDLLQLGGDGGASVWNHSSVSVAPPTFDDARFPPNLRFVEPLRGYEDYAITTDRAAIADLTWRYPLIVDKGVAATAWIFPASFVRQLDLELFGAGAVDKQRARHVAGGAAVSLRVEVLRFPLRVMYQLARRLTDDRAFTQLVAVGPDL